MKKIVISLAFLLSGVLLYGQANIGVDYFYLGEYGKAESNLKTQVASNPVQANFYLGQVAFAQGDMAMAEEFYKKVLAADPSYVPAQVGLAKLKLKTDRAAAENVFKELTKQTKKSAPLAVTIGRAYLESGMLTEAMAKVAEAIKYDSKYAPAYLLEGDIFVAGENPDLGAASGKYEQARYFDPQNLLAHIKLAQVYERRNPQMAMEMLNAAREIDPNYVIVYGMMGRIFTTNGYYRDAIEALKQYFQKAEYSANDLERMARAYYFGEAEKLGISDSQKFAEALRYVDEGLKLEPDHFVLNRYKMYLNAKMKNYEQGIQDAEKFFKLRESDETYISLDYITYGNILMGMGDAAGMTVQYDKAIALDPSKLEAYDEAINMARDLKDYGLAADFYQRMMDKKNEINPGKAADDRLFDLTTVGNLYYQAGTLTNVRRNPELVAMLMKDQNQIQRLMGANPEAIADSLKMTPEYFANYYAKYNLTKGEAAFKALIEASPDSYMGYYYMARTQNALLPGQAGIDAGLPKQYYEKTMQLIQAREGEMTSTMNRALRESLAYLGYYYYLTDNTENALLYSNKLLELDPENANAKAIIEDINSRKK